MKFFKRSERKNPKVSLILIDWGVRESYHILHYLSQQIVNREDFEVIIIEFYSRKAKEIEEFEDEVDTWIALEMPEEIYYHKHLMYNVGLVLSRGEIFMILDSDAMLKKTFILSVIEEFHKNDQIALHIDQFRNIKKDFYPFNYPSFEEVTGEGCVNFHPSGKTPGMMMENFYLRNYGSCFSVLRKNAITIGGADEQVYLAGFICGPYDLTFRLKNNGLKEIWHESEFTYHTWHPGTSGEGNYEGPHDGKHLSMVCINTMIEGRVFPLVENKAVQKIRKEGEQKDVSSLLINPDYFTELRLDRLQEGTSKLFNDSSSLFVESFLNYDVILNKNNYYVLKNKVFLNQQEIKWENLQKINRFEKVDLHFQKIQESRLFFYKTLRSIFSFCRFLKILIYRAIKKIYQKFIVRFFSFLKPKRKEPPTENLVEHSMVMPAKMPEKRSFFQKLKRLFAECRKQSNVIFNDNLRFILNIRYKLKRVKGKKFVFLYQNEGNFTKYFFYLNRNICIFHFFNETDFKNFYKEFSRKKINRDQIFFSKKLYFENYFLFNTKVSFKNYI